MPKYDATRYDPPAPVAVVSLRASPDSPFVHDVPLLIDTGADITLLPRAAEERAGSTPKVGKKYELVGFDGATRVAADAVELEVLLLNRVFRGLYLMTDDEHGILGRDVLASLKLVFDGPGQDWTEHQVSVGK